MVAYLRFHFIGARKLKSPPICFATKVTHGTSTWRSVVMGTIQQTSVLRQAIRGLGFFLLAQTPNLPSPQGRFTPTLPDDVCS